MPDRYSDVFDVDARKSDADEAVDMGPTTLEEQFDWGGYTRTTMPVGENPPPEQHYNTSGGRNAK
jgi:hypothetical protein